jgi:hypothetical protein
VPDTRRPGRLLSRLVARPDRTGTVVDMMLLDAIRDRLLDLVDIVRDHVVALVVVLAMAGAGVGAYVLLGSQSDEPVASPPVTAPDTQPAPSSPAPPGMDMLGEGGRDLSCVALIARLTAYLLTVPPDQLTPDNYLMMLPEMTGLRRVCDPVELRSLDPGLVFQLRRIEETSGARLLPPAIGPGEVWPQFAGQLQDSSDPVSADDVAPEPGSGD